MQLECLAMKAVVNSFAANVVGPIGWHACFVFKGFRVQNSARGLVILTGGCPDSKSL
jgi:hypothetical protein